MYKFFATRITKRISSHSVPYMPKQIMIHRSMRLCSFCNFYHWNTSKSVIHNQIRTKATTVNVLDKSPVKEKRKRTRKYTEILEVTNEKTRNKRTTVGKLNANNLFKFVNESNDTTDTVTLNTVTDSLTDNDALKFESNRDELFNIEMKDIDLESNNEDTLQNSIKNEHAVKNIEDCNEALTFKENKLLSNINKTVNKPKSKLKKDENYKKEKEKTFKKYINRLLVHMDVYISCGLINKADKILSKYRKDVPHKGKDHVLFYNLLIEAYASKGNFSKALQLYNTLKEDSLTPTTQTYVYILDALARGNRNVHQMANLKGLHYEMNQYDISFNDVLNKSYFKTDQRENVLKMVKLLMPQFKPSYAPINKEETYNLLHKVPIEDNYESPIEGLMGLNTLRNLLCEQIHNELAIEVEVENICKTNVKNTEVDRTKERIAELENHWKKAASEAFERNLKYLKEKESRNLIVFYPFLEVLDKNVYVDAIMREIKKLAHGSDAFSPSLGSLYAELGKYVCNKYEIKLKQENGQLNKIISIYQKYLEWYANPKEREEISNLNNRNVWQYIEWELKSCGASLNIEYLKWPTDLITNIGKFLFNIILNDIILLPNNLKGHDYKHSIPAFYTLFRNNGSYLTEQIKAHPIVSKLYKELSLEKIVFDSNLMPSCSPPYPWTSIDRGGYIILHSDFIRVPTYSDAPICRLQATPPEQLHPILDSLNNLSSIPWIINSQILDIVIKIFQEGGSDELNIPRSISTLTAPSPARQNATVQEKQQAAMEIAKYNKQKTEMYSLWCDGLYKFCLANHFRNKIFWLPHNLDFRGRVYPIAPHLNHISSDLGRSLLLFAKGKPLGPNGLDWLKIHVINLTGLKKKSSIKERLQYANEIIEDILDSASKPLTGKMWWLKSDEPWQTLAGCMEIADALNAPNPELYESHFPIHQDGSCNGLQHYAALGRDLSGARSVNLCPSDTPNDVYSAVADKVEKQRHEDASRNVLIAKVLEGHIKRKVIKQTVMTTVYGVTKYGARQQILKQLRDMSQFPEEHAWSASNYLVEKTFRTLRTMFTSARQIQDWLTMCAQLISLEFKADVEWITPLGLPIVQPYIKKKTVKDRMKWKLVKQDVRKQKNAFAPNFIHSLDSTHMMLTCVHSMQAGITFISIHDCFWTHACSVHTMNRICREQFIALHTEPILENLSKFFVQRYMPIHRSTKDAPQFMGDVHKSFTSVPKKGTLDINNVLSSKYFFS